MSSEFDEIEALELIALKSIEKPDFEYQLRRIKRWYSTTFFTPLHLVDDLNFHYVLQNYFEHTYSQLKDEDLGKIRNRVLHKKEMADIEIEDETWIENEMAEIAKKEKELAAQKSSESELQQLDQKFPPIHIKFEE